MTCPSCSSTDLTFTSAGPVGGWLADCNICGYWWKIPSVYERPWVAHAFWPVVIVLAGIAEGWV